MIELSDIKDEITKTWNAAKKESAFEFRAICTKYTGDTNINQHIHETIVRLKDYRDNGGLGNLYINTDPKPDLFDDSQTAIYHIGILSDDNLNLIANYYYEYFKKGYKELFELDNKREIKGIIYRCCYSFFVKIQTVKRLSDLLDKAKEKIERFKKEESYNSYNSNLILDPELEKGKIYFEKAIKNKLIEKTKDGLKWIGISKALLAYFLGKIYCGDKTYKDYVTDYVMIKLNPTFLPDTKLSKLFGLEKSIGRSRSQLKGKRAPGGYEKVDTLFQED